MTSNIEVIVMLDLTNKERKIDKVTIKPKITERSYYKLLKKSTKVIIRILPYAKEDKGTASNQSLPPIKEIKFNLIDLQKNLFKNQNVDMIQTKNMLEEIAKSFATYSGWEEEKHRREIQTPL